MINLNDKLVRQKLVRRYLNADTTLEEERLLADFLYDTDIALSDEEEDVLLMLHASDSIVWSKISEEKAEEFDCLMHKRGKKGKISTLYWIITAAAAIICAVMLLPVHHKDIEKKHPDGIISNIIDGQPHNNVNKKTQKINNVIPKSEDEPVLIAKHRATVHKQRKANIMKKAETGTSKIQDISTSELLETINILAAIGTDDITITASSCNDGCIIKIVTPNEPPSSYILKRCPDRTSIELKSQLIYF
ncbi:MAG: hypothetical protein IJQ05_02095 [Bacteroidaceae bacterium]|nr:hypothetical protein [Bacteroidaceae bacterium]